MVTVVVAVGLEAETLAVQGLAAIPATVATLASVIQTAPLVLVVAAVAAQVTVLLADVVIGTVVAAAVLASLVKGVTELLEHFQERQPTEVEVVAAALLELLAPGPHCMAATAVITAALLAIQTPE